MKKIVVLIITILMILLSFCNELLNNINKSKKKERTKVKLEEIKDNLNTGDIILIRQNNTAMKLDIIFGDEFSHSAMILKNEGETYLLDIYVNEVKFKGNNHTNPFNVNKLEEGLQKYKENATVCYRQWTPKLSEKEESKVKDYIKNNLHNKYRAEFITDFIENFKSYITKEESKLTDQIHCSEFITKLFENIGLIKNQDLPILMVPEYLATDKKITYLTDKKLGECKEIII